MASRKRKLSDTDDQADGENSLLKELTARLENAEIKLKLFTKEFEGIKMFLASVKGKSLQSGMRNLSLETTEVDSSEVTPRKQIKFTKENGYVVVYTDGACENNGKPNAKAGIGVYFGDDCPLNVSGPVVGRPTNNTAEIQACVCAVKIAHEQGVRRLKIKTDSQFVISSITQWIYRWKKNNWKLSTGGDVKNKEDIIKLDSSCQLLEDVQWEHVEGHKGHWGNEAADKLARKGATMYKK